MLRASDSEISLPLEQLELLLIAIFQQLRPEDQHTDVHGVVGDLEGLGPWVERCLTEKVLKPEEKQFHC